MFWKVSDGTGPDERLTTNTNLQVATSISPDGARVVLYEVTIQNGPDLRLLTLDAPSTSLAAGSSPAAGGSASAAGQRRVDALVQTSFVEFNADISPDGRWLAYQSNESGSFEIYVRPFPKVDGGRWQVSTGGGIKPAWSRNGRELFYQDPDGILTVVPVLPATGMTFSSGNPSRLFQTRYFSGGPTRNYDVSPDGRFLMIKDNAASDQTSTATPASMIVVLNWFEELKTRVK
jgi:serine/threonine-protein kinase